MTRVLEAMAGARAMAEDREADMEVTKVDESPPGTKQLLLQVYFVNFQCLNYSASVVISSIVFNRSRIIYWK